ncbi:hypothetical protein V8F20_012841 [Naviculisporaceae sp. PSN 640]
MKPQITTLTLLSIPSAALAARSCTPTANATPIRWTLSEFTYDSPDETARPGSRDATDAVVSLYLSDYSCFGAFNASWGGRTDPENYSVAAPLVWFPCVNSRGRSVDETVSFAIDWPKKELHVAHMYTCSDGDKKGQTTTASSITPLTTTCTILGGSTRCFTTERFIEITTTPDTLGTLSSPPPDYPRCTPATIGPLPSWQITSYTQLYYAFRNPAPTKPPGVGQGSDPTLFSVRYITADTAAGVQFKCSLSTPRNPPSPSTSILRRQSSEGSRIVRGICTDVDGVTFAPEMGWTFDPLYKTLTITQIPSCSDTGKGRTITLRGAGVLPDSACNASGAEGCDVLDPFWIGGETLE